MMSLGDVAASKGMPVFPCNDQKRPITDTGLKAASDDPETIRTMFARRGAVVISMPTGRRWDDCYRRGCEGRAFRHGVAGREWERTAANPDSI